MPEKPRRLYEICAAYDSFLRQDDTNRATQIQREADRYYPGLVVHYLLECLVYWSYYRLR